MKRILVSLILILASLLCAAQESAVQGDAAQGGAAQQGLTQQDADNLRIFEAVRSNVRALDCATTGELACAVALQLLGTPYVAGSIEGANEELRVYLDRTDCILFVELCTAFALTLKSGDPSFGALVSNIRQMRYRNGLVNGYASRIHYTSEWLIRNTSRGVLREYSRKYGSEFRQEFNFMSTHPQLYPHLSDDEELARIQVTEEFLQSGGPYWMITPERLRQSDVDIHEGDIVCFVSGVPGLDIAHVALAHKVGDSFHFIHASSKAGKVVVSDQSIADYARVGVRLARLK